VLDGEVDVTVMTARQPKQVTLRAGCVLVVPRGRWHRQRARRAPRPPRAPPRSRQPRTRARRRPRRRRSRPRRPRHRATTWT
jgi:hypothetical protein